jgi:alkylation response protein AidB-like acyl-CoA dehydrogenase
MLLQHRDELHCVARSDVEAERAESIDPLRRLFTLTWTPRAETCLAHGERARTLLDAAFDRGALATAAQQLGVAQQLLDTAVQYACTREQFGQAIGAFQAIKHMLANVAVRLEFARPVVYRAAFSVAHGSPDRAIAVSHAKAAASDAAQLAAKTALQVHGAIGYTWEVDLHLWMKRAWSLDLAWGSAAWHRQRIARRLFDVNEPAPTFGFSARRA